MIQESTVSKERLRAQIKFTNSFKDDAIQVMDFLSGDIAQHLKDYFILIGDLKNGLGEEMRCCYSDYGFVVFPVHKAFETYIYNIFHIIFQFNFSKSPNEKLGYYLSCLGKDAKVKFIEGVEKNLNLKLTVNKWVNMWEALANEWSINRNPLTHFDGEKITTLDRAELAASSIMREMDVSGQLIASELFMPLKFRIIEEQKKKDEEENKLQKAKIERLKELAKGIQL